MAKKKSISSVLKRDGRVVKFSFDKITKAIKSAYKATEIEIDQEKLTKIEAKIKKQIDNYADQINVEEIQDIVEDALLSSKENEVAKNYIRYRAKRTQSRDAKSDLMQLYNDIYFKPAENLEIKRDNANINGNSSMGIMRANS